MVEVEIEGIGTVELDDSFLNATPEVQQATIEEIHAQLKKPEKPSEDSSVIDKVMGPLREFAGGASFQFADELEAGFRSLVDRIPTEADRIAQEINPEAEPEYLGYSDFKEDIAQERGEFKEENPWLSLGLEFGGAITTGGAVSKLVGLGSTVRSAAVRQGGAGAVEAGVYGFGSGETLEERVEAASYGVALGAPLGAGIGAVAQRMNPVYQKNKLIEAVGKMDDTELASVLDQQMATRVLKAKVQGATPKDIPPPVALVYDVADDLKIPSNKVKALGRKLKGFNDHRGDSIEDLRKALSGEGLYQSMEEAAKIAARPGAGTKAVFDSVVAPAKRMMINQVGEKFANFTNRGLNRGLLQSAKYHDEVVGPLKPLTKFLDEADNVDAQRLKGAILDAAMGEDAAWKEVGDTITSMFGEDAWKAYQKFDEANLEWAKRYNKNINQFNPVTRHWVHSQVVGDQRPAGLITSATDPNTASRTKDVSSLTRTRREGIRDRLDDVARYDNPIRTMQDWIDDNANQINVAEIFQLRPRGRRDIATATDKASEKITKQDRKSLVKGEKKAGSVGAALAERMKAEGYSDVQIENARQLMHNVLFDAQRAPSSLIRSIRNLGYAGTIMNPYGAVLNLHDVFNGMTAMGVRNGISTLFRKSELSAKDVGLASQYAGEYVKRLGNFDNNAWAKWTKFTEQLVEKSGFLSGFRYLDGFGKSKIMQMALNQARNEIRKGSFDKTWENTFTSSEIMQLKAQLAKSDKPTDLMKELAMFRLSELQPINPAQSARYSLENPNARVLYMLKGFAIRQLDFLRRNSIDEWKKGNKAKAMAFAAKYALVSGGGFALVQEARQPVKFDEADFSPENLASLAGRQMASVGSLGAAGASDFAWDKFWDNPVEAFAQGLIPPLNIPMAVWDDSKSIIEGESPTKVLSMVPVVGKVIFEPLLSE